jgi:hypothetical protein
MKKVIPFLSAIMAAFILITAPACRKGGNFSRQENEAVVISTAWLQLIDDEKYSRSWTETAGIFRKSVSQDKWIRLLSASRKPFGTMISRTLYSREYTASLPGAPDGEYVVIIYKTSFRNKKESVETITPMKDVDGKWRVSGYYIK